ncbi:unnamed protein product [Schistosoma turkestanicum]|nr:unnamed protein product [Schistosoma turkestanicum]
MKTKKLKTQSYYNEEKRLQQQQQNTDNGTMKLNEQSYTTLFDQEEIPKSTNQWNENISTNSILSCIFDL